MQYGEFLGTVQRRADLEDEQRAKGVVQATLETLAEVLPPDAADNLAAQLPEDLGDHVRRPDSQTGTGSMGLDDFCSTVAEREGGDASSDEARAHARAVMTTLRDALTDGKFTDLVAQLPEGYGALFEQG